MSLSPRHLILTPGTGVDPTIAAVVADPVHCSVVDHRGVVSVVNVGDVDVVYRTVVVEAVVIPSSAVITVPEVAIAITDPAIETYVRTPVAFIENISTVAPTPITRGPNRLEPPPEARIERLPLATPLDDIVKRHEQRITELLRAHPERTPVHFETFEDVIASIARAHVAMARHRQKVGGLSRDELERLKGRPLSPTEEAFLREVQGKPE